MNSDYCSGHLEFVERLTSIETKLDTLGGDVRSVLHGNGSQPLIVRLSAIERAVDEFYSIRKTWSGFCLRIAASVLIAAIVGAGGSVWVLYRTAFSGVVRDAVRAELTVQPTRIQQ